MSSKCYNIEIELSMRILSLTVALLLLICVSCGEYQLEFDWKSNTTASDIEFCTLVWNNLTVSKLKESKQANTIHHQKFMIDFNQGTNLLNFFYFGLKGNITIDNVKITRPPKTINLLVNGDFELPLLTGTDDYTYSDKIPGWNGYKITLTKDSKIDKEAPINQGLVLNGLAKSINQKISFGRTRKYSFRSSIKQEVQTMVSDMMAKKKQMCQNATSLTSQIHDEVMSEFEQLKKRFASSYGSSLPSTPSSIEQNPSGVPEMPALPSVPTVRAPPTMPSMPV